VPMDEWVYHALNALAWMALAGLTANLVRLTARGFRELSRPSSAPPSGGGTGVILRDFIQGRAPLVLTGLFGVIVVAALTQWATVTWSSQGRLVFSAIPTWSIFLVLGLVGLWLRDSRRRHASAKTRRLDVFVSRWLSDDRIGRWIACAVCVFMFGVAALAPFTTIAPAYARPAPAASLPETRYAPVGEVFDGQLKLVGWSADRALIRPGEQIEVVLYWQAAASMGRDYSTFVHLLDGNDIVVAQRDMFPGQGLWPTSQMRMADVIPSRYLIRLPPTAYAPDTLTVEVGVYDFDSGERLRAADGRDSLRLGPIELRRDAGTVPNPVSYDLGGQIELMGYDMDRRVAAPGQTIKLTLYWRAKSSMSIDYTVFTHVLQPPQTLWAGMDKPLLPPTTAWSAGQVVSDTYDLTLKPETPPGVYEVEIGVYDGSSPTFERLRIVTDDGRITDNFILLSRVRVR